MYFSRNMFERYVSYQEMNSQVFFHEMCKKAIKRYQRGVKLPSNKTPVVYGSSVKDFDKEKDGVMARLEMNERGVLRDFIAIDWDFKEGDEDKLNTLIESYQAFAQEYETYIYIYATKSYPTAPRVRTVVFTDREMDATEYAKAVTFMTDKANVDHEDEFNYFINHNFNLPVINNKAQYERLTLFAKKGYKPLDNDLWKDVEPKKKVNAYNKYVKKTRVMPDETIPHSRQEVDKGLAHLKTNMQKGTNKKLDFKVWLNFFQFLHAVARAETIGSITHDQALYILKMVAGGNQKWKYRNIEDYRREFPRVRDNKEKLERARLLSYYFGQDW